MKAWLLIPISLSLVAGTARADQCAWIDDAAAHKARTILTSSPAFVELCEPCGDKAPGAPQRAKTVDVKDADGDYKEVYVNGKGIDLAYVFVKTDDTHYGNLAALAGCPATGVSPSLDVAAETAHGVLITADDDARFSQPPPPKTSAPTLAPLFALSPQVYYTTTTTREVSWPPIALAAAGGFIIGSAFTIMLLGLRRRRAMRPRATDLDARQH